MNIVEYRALKAQESATPAEQPTPVVTAPTEQPTQPTAPVEQSTAPIESTPPTEQPATLPTEIEIDGVLVPIDELKSGYLRQSDYTRKTQELASQKAQTAVAEKLLQSITANPEVAEQLAREHGISIPDAQQLHYAELNKNYQDLLLQQTVSELKSQYDDFDTLKVIEFAYQNKYENLEDAYLLMKSREGGFTAKPDVDIDSIKEQIRQELLQELKLPVDTTTIIQGGGESTPVTNNVPVLSSKEVKIAKGLGMSPVEYAKWRDKR